MTCKHCESQIDSIRTGNALTVERFEKRLIGEALATELIEATLFFAKWKGARQDVIDHITLVTKPAILSIAEKQNSPIWGHIVCRPNVVEKIIFLDKLDYRIDGLRAFAKFNSGDANLMDRAVTICRRGRHLSSVISEMQSSGIHVSRI